MKTRLEELTVRLLDGEISEAEFEELERLVEDPRFAEIQAGLFQIEALLRGRKRLDVSEGALDLIRRERAERIERRVMDRVRRPSSTGARTWMAWSAAAGILLAMTLTVIWATRPSVRPGSPGTAVLPWRTLPQAPEPPPPMPRPLVPVPKNPPALEPPVPVPVDAPEPPPAAPTVPSSEPKRAPTLAPSGSTRAVAEAAVESVVGEVVLVEGATKTPAVPGLTFPAGRTLMTLGRDSRASVRWPDKTKVELDPETRLSRLEDVAGEKMLAVQKGSISVSTPLPMTVKTTLAEAKVLGTRFTVMVTSSATRLTVQEGKVRLTRGADRASADVPAGFFATAGPGPKPAAHAVDPLPKPPAGKVWSLRFAEEFDDPKVDRARWGVAQEVRKAGVWNPRNVRTEDGRLSITTSRVGDRLVSGSLSTAGKFEQAFGYFSARLKFPTQPGHSPSFGLGCRLSPGGGREGTLIQVVTKPEQTDLYHHHLAWGDGGPTWARWDVTGMGIAQDWHTFGLWWTADEYVFYVDGRETWRTRQGGVSQVPEYLFLADEVDEGAGDIRRATLPDQFQADHVRAYALVSMESGK